jgi:hypothetical protein
MKLRLAFFALALLGCLSSTQRREDDLIREARMFNDDLRWARWDQMGAAMPADEKKLFLERVELVGTDLVMCDFEVKGVHFEKESNTATVKAYVEWYMKTDPNVRNATLVQTWENRTGRWLMVKQRRSHGDRFPLVTEPVKKPAADSKPEPVSKPAE